MVSHMFKKFLFVDAIGVCKETFDLSHVTMKSTGKELTKRDLQLVDTTAREVSIILNNVEIHVKCHEVTWRTNLKSCHLFK